MKRKLPERPAWWKAAFPAPAQERSWSGDPSRPKETDPRALAAEKAEREAQGAHDHAERARLFDKAGELRKAADTIPGPTPIKSR
jgi:hypothetical protein